VVETEARGRGVPGVPGDARWQCTREAGPNPNTASEAQQLSNLVQVGAEGADFNEQPFVWPFVRAPPRGLQVVLELVTQRQRVLRVGFQGFFPQLWTDAGGWQPYKVPLRMGHSDSPLRESVDIVLTVQPQSASLDQALYSRVSLQAPDEVDADVPGVLGVSAVPPAVPPGSLASFQSAGVAGIPFKHLHLGRYRCQDSVSRNLRWLAVWASARLYSVPALSCHSPAPSRVRPGGLGA